MIKHFFLLALFPFPEKSQSPASLRGHLFPLLCDKRFVDHGATREQPIALPDTLRFYLCEYFNADAE